MYLARQSGDIGAFDAATLLLSLTSSLGLLAVATLIVDNLLTRCWPRQAVYKQLKNFAFEDVELTSEQLKRFENEARACGARARRGCRQPRRIRECGALLCFDA